MQLTPQAVMELSRQAGVTEKDAERLANAIQAREASITTGTQLVPYGKINRGQMVPYESRNRLPVVRDPQFQEMVPYTTGPGFPGSTNVYVPTLKASGPLIVGYSRNVKDFPLPRWVKYVESTNTVGYYMRLSDQQAARVVTVRDADWPDNQSRTLHEDGLEQFNLVQYRTIRKNYGFNVGRRTSQQAVWDLVEIQKQIMAAQAMTDREVVAIANITAANFSTTNDPDMTTNHTATASAFAGGYLDQGTSTAPYIKKFLNKGAVTIGLDTLSVVKASELHCVINPDVARLMSESSEIHEYIKGSYWSREELDRGIGPNTRYGLPSTIYGYDFVIDDTVQVTSRKPASTTTAPTRVWAFPDQAVLLAGRPGALEGVAGAPNFSTMTMFWYQDEMTVETREDSWNRLIEGSVVQDMTFDVTSPISGFYLTSATSTAS